MRSQRGELPLVYLVGASDRAGIGYALFGLSLDIGIDFGTPLGKQQSPQVVIDVIRQVSRFEFLTLPPKSVELQRQLLRDAAEHASLVGDGSVAVHSVI